MANEEEIKGLKAQVKWCIESIQKLVEVANANGAKLEIQEPPTTPPPPDQN